jgi:hypothetical protein
MSGRLPESTPYVHPAAAIAGTREKRIGKAIVFHDSFGDNMKAFLARRFDKVIFRKRDHLGLDTELIEREHPDVVIQIAIERRLSYMLPERDWSNWIVETIRKQDGSTAVNDSAGDKDQTNETTLSIMPRMAAIDDNRFNDISRQRHFGITATTLRQWTPAGDKFTANEKDASKYRWFLLKTGDQGLSFADKTSKESYASLVASIESENGFHKVSQMQLLDGSWLKLYHCVKTQ